MSKQKKRQSLRSKLMIINVSITLASFILCGLMLVMAVSFQVSRYIRHDLDFFLTEMSGNLEGKLKYMEDVILQVRRSEDILNYLKGESDEGQSQRVKEAFTLAVDISAMENQGEEEGPIVDKVYLFREDTAFLSDYYYALVYSEIDESDIIFCQIYAKYLQSKTEMERFHSISFPYGERVYMAFPVLDDTMEEKGTLIFEVNIPAIKQVMESMDNYNDSFWILFNGNTVLGGSEEPDADRLLEAVSYSQHDKPFVGEVEGRRYRMYQSRLCLNMQMILGIPENQTWFILYDSLDFYVIGIVATLAALLFGFVFFTYKLTKPIEEVTRKLGQVKEGDFETKLPDYDDREFYEISQVFNQMTEYINHLVKQVYEKQISIKEMELKFLQTQMNPHFMFNVLNAIALQAKIDGNEEICRQISTFSQLIQAKIYRSDTEKVQIRQELEYAKYYLEIQKFRYGDRLSYTIEIQEEEVLNMYLPKLCIQLIVENAVVHGLEPKMGNGSVEIVIGRGGQGVFIEIMDDGIGFGTEGEGEALIPKKPADAAHNHVGLSNVNHIIKLMYGEEYGISISSHTGEKTRVCIHIPEDKCKECEE